VRERNTIGQVIFAHGTQHTRLVEPTGCKTYRVSWRLRDRFFGVGNYTINVRVRDSGRKISNTLTRRWFTAD
jgi:hypothetical protein